jgi:hypothetical protein
MKKLSLLVIFLLSIVINAQKISVDLTKSQLYKDKKKQTNLLYSENDGNGGLIVVRNAKSRFRISSKEYYIDHYNSDLSLIETYTLKNERWASLKGIIIKDNQINLIQLISKKGKVTVNRLVSPVDHLDFIKKELFILTKQKFNEYFSAVMKTMFSVGTKGKLEIDHEGNICFSHKKNYITFYFDIKGKAKTSYLFLIFDNNFNKVYEKVFIKNIKDRLFDITDVAVNENDASIYLLGKIFENNSRRSKKNHKTNYHYEMYKINKDAEEVVSFKSKEFIHSLKILQRKDVLYLVGFYSEKKDSRSKGVCRFNLATDLRIKDKKFNPFSDQFFKDKYRKGKDVSNRKKEVKHIDYRDIFLDNNNSIIINAEEFYITESQSYISNTNGGGHWTTTIVYHYVDIISTKIDGEGKLVWARNINKHQTNPSTASYASTIVDDTVYFILNASDHINTENGGLSFGYKLFNLKAYNLFVFSISGKGEINYKKLIDSKDLDVRLNMRNAVISKDFKSVYIQGRKGRKKQLIKLKL